MSYKPVEDFIVYQGVDSVARAEYSGDFTARVKIFQGLDKAPKHEVLFYIMPGKNMSVQEILKYLPSLLHERPEGEDVPASIERHVVEEPTAQSPSIAGKVRKPVGIVLQLPERVPAGVR